MSVADEPVFTTHDYAIGGKLVVGRATYNEAFAAQMQSDMDFRKTIKQQLIHQMATYMLENNLVEFMQQQNPMDMSTTVLVRAYIAPNDQVKILRLANKIV